jgi:AraC family transcriptional regulator
MDADVHEKFRSGFYRILDFRCRCTECRTSKPEYSQAMSISFVRKGNFLFNLYRNALDAYSGCVIVTKPDYERTVTHVHVVPDECTIIELSDAFAILVRDMYADTLFFNNPDLHSTLVKSGPDLSWLHYRISRLMEKGGMNRLLVDDLVLEVIQKVLRQVTDYIPDVRIDERLKRRHLMTIERAREYITEHFMEDISLSEMAAYCFVSPFHFSRIFTLFTGSSPHQFLLSLRLQHAKALLSSTTLPIADIAYGSGFNSAEHFTASFTQRYRCSPSGFREEWA